ncbi:MAG: cobalt-zinc-cadmium efflux system protein [Syntrophus sp. SKADARSKE-3]|nr:cobalt-zinc-cadmium efflux system protein [Syntrophus sp. SKADARSKE-3]
MGHQHEHNPEVSWGRRLLATMVMNLIIPVVQIYGGIISGSMALISDALHNLSDLISVAISYTALRIGQGGPSLKQTFGYKRVEVFAALVNVALLYAVAFYIAIEGWHRFQHPEPIREKLVIAIALIGFLGNLISTVLLHSGAKTNVNMRGAFLHMLSDALTSLGVAVIGIIWIFRPWYWLDPVASWIIVVMILYGGWGILKETFLILMNATPPGIDPEAIQREIEAIDGVLGIHHLHVWSTTADSISLAAHITVPDQMMSGVDELACRIRELLGDHFGIHHPFLQFETESCAETGLLCCTISKNDHADHEH